MADFVRLVPSMLKFGQSLIQHNPFPIRKVKRLERGVPDRVDEQHGPLVHLDAGDADPTDRLIQDAGIIGSVEREIEMQQFAHILQPERGFGMAEPPQHTLDATLDVSGRLGGNDSVLGQTRNSCLYFCSLSTEMNASRAAPSSGVNSAVGSDRAAKRTASSNNLVSFGAVSPATCMRPDRGNLK